MLYGQVCLSYPNSELGFLSSARAVARLNCLSPILFGLPPSLHSTGARLSHIPPGLSPHSLLHVITNLILSHPPSLHITSNLGCCIVAWFHCRAAGTGTLLGNAKENVVHGKLLLKLRLSEEGLILDESECPSPISPSEQLPHSCSEPKF